MRRATARNPAVRWQRHSPPAASGAADNAESASWWSNMFERFTDRARKVMSLANQEAQRFNHEYIGTEHILLGLVKEGSGVGANVLKNLDVDLRKVRLEVEKLVKSGPEMVTLGKLPQTPRAKKVVEYAIEEARSLNHNYVGTEHLLLGLLREHDGVAAQVLLNLGLKLDGAREEVLNLLGAGAETVEADDQPAAKTEKREKPRAQQEMPEVVRQIIDELDQLEREKREAVEEAKYERAATLRDRQESMVKDLEDVLGRWRQADE